MKLDGWESLYRDAVEKACESLDNIEGMFVAYNANVDAIKFLDAPTIEKMVSGLDPSSLLKRMKEYPREADTPLDLVARLLISIEKGKAAEVPVYDMDMEGWLTQHFEPDEVRIGGQAGIITNLLARLNIASVITYVPWLSRREAELFETRNNNVFSPAIVDGRLALVPPPRAARHSMGKTNWILEYKKGLTIEIGKRRIVCPRDNRLILSFRPPWIRLHMDEEVFEHLTEVCAHVDGAVLSGYQIIKRSYEDGTTHETYVNQSVRVIEKLKHISPELKVHVEFSSIQDRVIRETILKDIVRAHVHSLGLDAVEVANALNVLGHEELAASVLRKESIEHLFEGVRILTEELDLERIHVHALGLYICVLRSSDVDRLTQERTALLFASALGAAKAMKGRVESREDAYEGLRVPVSDYGIEALKRLGAYLDESTSGEGTLSDGIAVGERFSCVCIPTKVVESPVATVGLGDTISAGAFAVSIAGEHRKPPFGGLE